MSEQNNVENPADELFEPDQTKRHKDLMESGAFDNQPHKLAEDQEKARKNKEQKEARELAKQQRADAIVALAKKHDQSVGGIELLLSQMSKDPVNTLDSKLENEQRIEKLERELRIVESLYQELLMKVDHLEEKDPNSQQMTVAQISEELGITMDQAAEVLVKRPAGANGENLPLYGMKKKEEADA